MLRLAFGVLFAVTVTAVACEGGGESISEPTGGALSASETDDDLLSYELAIVEVQRAVGRAGFGVADGILEFDLCISDQQCADAMLLLADEYVPYVILLDEQIGALNEIDPPPAFRSFHENFIKQLSFRQEAGELWIEGVETLDEATAVGLLTLSQEKFRESQLLYFDILDDIEELTGERR